ncbi:hypothetical protein, partial [Klebsiella aerogenes]|uniref:hypothetical protein n=1 Tax=Klebsiella aerogenes TaxID=548 RepID=UPI0019532F9A
RVQSSIALAMGSVNQVKNLFDNVSAGINQLAGGIFPQGMPPMFMGASSGEEKRKVVHQILE